jgi:hypothetical protein
MRALLCFLFFISPLVTKYREHMLPDVKNCASVSTFFLLFHQLGAKVLVGWLVPK